MFDSLNNLTKREKILAIATVSSLVVTLIFIAFFWFMTQYSANEAARQAIDGQIQREDAKTRQAMSATRRKAWYTATSLSSHNDTAKNEYIAWLTRTLREDIGADLPKGVNVERTTPISHEGVKVADQISFSINPKMTLKQLTEFLSKFYSVDALHRITSLRLTRRALPRPRNRCSTGAKNNCPPRYFWAG